MSMDISSDGVVKVGQIWGDLASYPGSQSRQFQITDILPDRNYARESAVMVTTRSGRNPVSGKLYLRGDLACVDISRFSEPKSQFLLIRDTDYRESIFPGQIWKDASQTELTPRLLRVDWFDFSSWMVSLTVIRGGNARLHDCQWQDTGTQIKIDYNRFVSGPAKAFDLISDPRDAVKPSDPPQPGSVSGALNPIKKPILNYRPFFNWLDTAKPRWRAKASIGMISDLLAAYDAGRNSTEKP